MANEIGVSAIPVSEVLFNNLICIVFLITSLVLL